MSNLLIKRYKLPLLAGLLALLIPVLGLTIAVQSVHVQTAYAAKPTAKDIEAFCRSSGREATQASCRNGFREGYKPDKSKDEACGDKRPTPYATPQEKNSCKRGYDEGESIRTSEALNLGKNSKSIGGDVCGNSDKDHENVHTKFNFGCVGTDYKDGPLSPILDVTYAIIRFLSAGVGIAVVIAIIMAGIKYSSSEGNPEATQDAKNKIRTALISLLIYIFAFSLIQYLVPGGVFS